jgi:phosphatidate cytidylyltransferase
MNELLKRTLSGIVFAAIVIGFIYSGANGMTSLCIVLSIVGITEFAKLRRMESQLQVFLLVFISVALILHAGSDAVSIPFFQKGTLAIAASFALLYVIIVLWKKGLEAYSSIADGVFAIVYVAVPLVLFIQFAHRDGYTWQRAMLPLLLVWSSDTFAYLSGRWLGKTPLYPSLSPKKTIEGFVGGTVLTAALGAVLCYVWDLSGPLSGLILGLAVSTFGTAGDLFESALKRNAGVKDSGNLIPGHGGVLDRFDAFFFACFVVWIWSIF